MQIKLKPILIQFDTLLMIPGWTVTFPDYYNIWYNIPDYKKMTKRIM